MNYKAYLLLVTSIVFISTKSEMHNFNMALKGDFAKDYCQVRWNNGSRRDIDTTSLLDYQIRDGRKISPGTTSYRLTCAKGRYDIFLTNTESGRVHLKNENLQLYQVASMNELGNYDSYTYGKEVTALRNANALNVEFTDNDYLGIFYRTFAEPITGSWLETGDKFKHTFTSIITIEKR